ncbi:MULTISPECIES: pilus assembly PilX family protein [unclassified Acidovorax]|uniref:pilus assembly PilX family protein n=1 Tax=unclassified Acidovorax TaxID=2684926 RepID=UPI000B403FED|nr:MULTISPECIES: pilus assembly PilX N-terminal domain-containing protein [unclassified Acidovorax]
MTLFTNSNRSTRNPRLQRGATTLVVSLILLFGMTLVAFFVNRSMLFEQKTSANQLRSTKAFEAAEAGIEWATAMLNDPRYVNTTCTTTGTGNTKSFRTKYLGYDAAEGFLDSTKFPSPPPSPVCRMNGTAEPVCSCLDTGIPSLSTTTDPTFTVELEPFNATTIALKMPGATPDKESVLVTSYGCTSVGSGNRCEPDNTNKSDAYQKISIIVKLRPAVRAVPAAAITTGGSLQLTSAASSVSNTDPGSNGILVNAGGGINNTAVPGCNGAFKEFQNTSTLSGTPWQNSMIANDASLSSLSADPDPDAMFKSYFGTTIDLFKSDVSTKILGNCGNVTTDYASAFAQGYRSFYTTCYFDAQSNLGSPTDPVIFVTTNGLKFNGGEKIYGLVYGDQATWDQVGLGNGEINGALIVRGNYCANANANYNYDAEALKKIRGATGSMVRVPGSWKDF